MNNSQLQGWLGVMRDPQSGRCKDRLQDVADSNSRCCLGHLGYSMGATIEIRLNEYRVKAVHYSYGDGIDSNVSVLPSALAKELDITRIGDFIKDIKIGDTSFACMAEVNDKTDLTIAEIADVIEAQYKAKNVARFHNVFE